MLLPWRLWVRRGLASVTSSATDCSARTDCRRAFAGFPHGTDRHWELDPLPLLIAKSEWDSLSAALAQRVQLLNLILADLYGPQNLIREGLLPPELVFGQRGFLLPCHGVAVPRNIFLHLYAGHLARGADGRWSVFADYTQGPPGAGLALENRIVTSRILPSDFHSLHVERLAGFFITLRDTLQSLSSQQSDNPRVILLSPGPRSPTYFEDAYLARYLGYTLVEGGDLTVRGTNVYLKTLAAFCRSMLSFAACTTRKPIPWSCAPTRRTASPGLSRRRGAGRSSWQCLGQRPVGIARAHGFPAGDLPPSIGRRIEASLGADVVVRARRRLVLH